ncbi:MAG: helix-turn-helix transcriptional regulator [Proteobacteria bacterium]|nr:helix-turn-helix transcriptional regulator [Pseudomonadota bacterium]
MPTLFDSPAWHAKVAGLVAAADSQTVAARLISFIGSTVSNNGTSLLAFHKDAPPEVVHHSLAPSRARHYLDRYLAGPYLLDPLYQLALRSEKPTMCRFRDAQPDRFHSSEYYRQYVERTHLVDEMDFLLGVSPTSALVIVCGRTEKRFTRLELSRLRLIEPIVRSAMQRVADGRNGAQSLDDHGRSMHQRLTECFENFGDGILTQREREITHLLLRGHSSKSIARELGIAPGTVMVHKRNLFAKLGITSQYELFSRFIDDLSGS